MAADLSRRQTATAIVIFQDVAGILLLVVASALGGGAAVLPTVGLALLKAVLAFGVTVVLARVVASRVEDVEAVSHFARAVHPNLRRIAAVKDRQDADRVNALGLETVVGNSRLPGLDLAAFVLRQPDEARIAAWRKRTEARAAAPPEEALKLA